MDEQARIDYDAHQKELAISHSVIDTSRMEGKAKANETIVCNAYKKQKM